MITGFDTKDLEWYLNCNGKRLDEFEVWVNQRQER